MNQDFALLATPAIARRLLLLPTPQQITQEIVDLAQQNCIDESCFDPFVCTYGPVQHQATQFLLDCGLRGIVQANIHSEIDHFILLNAVRLAKPDKLTVITSRTTSWRNAARATDLEGVLQCVRSEQINSDLIEQRRTGVLVIDVDNKQHRHKVAVMVREFRRSIIYEPAKSFNDLTHWTIWATMLFPTMPHPAYPRIVGQWQDKPVASFAPFYNACIFPQFITSARILDHLHDRELSQHFELPFAS